MTEHCFISYSTADALEYARKLANELEGGDDKYVNVWFDKRNLKPGIDWRPQLADAIRECKCLLFIMTKDSLEPQSMTNEEWAFALKYKKPIIPLRFHSGIDLPFGLGRRQWVDFTGEFEHGLAQLRKRLNDLDSPKGQLQLLRDRLADAERDLRRATAEDEARIKSEIEQLKNDIKMQDVIVKDPAYAEKRTKKNISAGLLEERKPTDAKTEAKVTKFINPIPLVVPSYFQGRLPELSQMSEYLKSDHQRILTIIGRGGGGKTALACCLLKNLEQGKLPEGLGEFKVSGIVYLSEIGSHKVSFANIYSSLLQLLPPEVSERLEILYRQPKITTGEKMRQILEAFQQDKAIVLLDNFELFVDTQSENLLDGDLKDALEAILRAPNHSLKVIITTRTPARDVALIEPSRHNNLHLEEGLKSPYAENVLRAMDEDGRVGFKSANDEQLGRARELTLGYPRALESLYAIISVDRYTSIEELLAVELPETVIENLVGEAFSRLDATAQKVIQALAIYNRPVPSAAIDYLLQQHIPGINSSPILARLVSMHFARREAGRFYLHPVDREYAFNRISEGEIGKHVGKGARSRIWDQYSLTLRAADYFVESRKPAHEWKKLDDLNAQLSEFDLRITAEDCDNAATILNDLFHDYLRVWGHYQLVLDLAVSIEAKIKNIVLRIQIITIIGVAHTDSGKAEIALKYYFQGLNLAQQFNHRGHEAALLTNIGGAYSEVGDIVKCIEYNEKSLNINREIKSKSGEASSLGNLGVAYADLGEFNKALSLHKQGLDIEMKHSTKASISITHENIGDCLLGLDEPNEAISNYEKSIQIATEINFIQTQCYARWGLAQVYLLQREVEKALSIIVEAKTYNVPQISHNIFTLQGIIFLRLNNAAESRKSFELAVIRANEIISTTPNYYDAIDAKALALCGMSLLVDKQYLGSAKNCFLIARKITNAAGIVNRVMRLFNELSICDSKGLLAEIRPIAEGKDELISKP